MESMVLMVLWVQWDLLVLWENLVQMEKMESLEKMVKQEQMVPWGQLGQLDQKVRQGRMESMHHLL